jgi:3-dehydroquinate synthase
MVASAVSEQALTIRSHTGQYAVSFDDDGLAALNRDVPADTHFIIDAQVAEIYAGDMEHIMDSPSVLLIEATEANKSLDRFPVYVRHLVDRQMRRDHILVAIGGGIIQDITCFLAATMLRGVAWRFYPTTLLAQADSCIGSKSSINAGDAKNVLGTFTPPRDVVIGTRFLETLDERDVRSGVGEMIKVHAIEGAGAFDRIAADYRRLFTDRAVMGDYIRAALDIKKRYIEEDEFDQGIRNCFNYGHSFGHAMEAATDFTIPHGIAVTIGMDMANHVAARLGVGSEDWHARMHPTLAANYVGFEDHDVPTERFFSAIAKDKKNISGALTLILPDGNGTVFKDRYPLDDTLRLACIEYFEGGRRF